jgi:hypothetical protein
MSACRSSDYNETEIGESRFAVMPVMRSFCSALMPRPGNGSEGV